MCHYRPHISPNWDVETTSLYNNFFKLLNLKNKKKKFTIFTIFFSKKKPFLLFILNQGKITSFISVFYKKLLKIWSFRTYNPYPIWINLQTGLSKLFPSVLQQLSKKSKEDLLSVLQQSNQKEQIRPALWSNKFKIFSKK